MPHSIDTGVKRLLLSAIMVDLDLLIWGFCLGVSSLRSENASSSSPQNPLVTLMVFTLAECFVYSNPNHIVTICI